ncbi:hypothetical protein T484DRAFT_3282989 [Baffinella frigidus]|nr:hypothetical protein T484DRAFT_3282989 [Cryptophyta sp. CCMP2293]
MSRTKRRDRSTGVLQEPATYLNCSSPRVLSLAMSDLMTHDLLAQPAHPFVAALLGGIVLGSAVAFRMYAVGGILGISGLTGGLVKGKHAELERIAFFGGLLTGGVLGFGIVPGHLRPFADTYSIYRALLAGSAVGFGTGLGSGCTSGHGIGGLSRFSPRSAVAVATFMLTGAVSASLASSAAATVQATPLGAVPTWGAVLTGTAIGLSILLFNTVLARFAGKRDGMIHALDPTDPVGRQLALDAKVRPPQNPSMYHTRLPRRTE